jgi:hypothetical protein
VNSTARRVARLEQAAGCEGDPCPLCERREQAAREPSRAFSDEWERRPGPSVNMKCPRCGRPFVLNVVYVSRKDAAV